jgi:mono/diheme cytochrome c family protein
MKGLIGNVAYCVLCAGLALMAQTASADSVDTTGAADGKQVYEHVCQGCHMPEGKGAIGAGQYPALAANPNLASAQYAALTVLNGRRNMPAFGERDLGFDTIWFSVVLTDEQVASVVNYVRSHFGNAFDDQLSAAEVEALRPR